MKRSLSVAAAMVLLIAMAPSSLAVSPAAISWSPASWSFPTLPAAGTASKLFTLTNTGGKASAALQISVTGSAFLKTQDGCSGRSLGPGKNCTVTVQFTAPASAGPVSGSLRANSVRPVAATAALNGISNRAPDAVDDTLANIFDTDPPFDYGWLANDIDPDGDPFLVTAVTAPTGSGTVSIVGGGTGITYDSNEETGPDSFTYTITDNHGASDTATVTMFVQDLFIDYTYLCYPLALGPTSGAANSSVHIGSTASRPNVETVILWDDTTEIGTTTSGTAPSSPYVVALDVTIPAGASLGNHTIRLRERGNAAQPYVGCNQSAIFTVTP